LAPVYDYFGVETTYFVVVNDSVVLHIIQLIEVDSETGRHSEDSDDHEKCPISPDIGDSNSI